MPTSITKLPLAKLRLDGGTQPRATIDDSVVEQYADDLESGAKFPPVIAYHDGTDHWLADGFHRAKSHEKAGRKTIDADVRQGTQRDAILYAVGSNNAHGLPRTNADKRRAVMTMLTNDSVMLSETGKPWSDNAIARLCNVSGHYVGNIRSVTMNVHSEEKTYTTKNGTVATMNTANIGRKSDAQIADTKEHADATDDLLADAKRAAEAKASKPRPEPKDDQLDGGVMDGLTRKTEHVVTRVTFDDPGSESDELPPVPDGPTPAEIAKSDPALNLGKLVYSLQGGINSFLFNGTLKKLKSLSAAQRRPLVSRLKELAEGILKLKAELE